MVVGGEKAGKTSLLNSIGELFRLQWKNSPFPSSDDPSELSAHGIETRDINIKGNSRYVGGTSNIDISFTIWDFPGTVDFLPTHQFFFSNRTIYLLVFNLMELSPQNFEYWLKIIHCR